MEDIIIIGAGGFGREVKCLIEEINNYSDHKKFNILGFLDDAIEEGTPIQNLKVLGNIEYLKTLSEKPSLVFGLSTPIIKRKIFKELRDYNFPIIIHPKVSLKGYNIKLGKGCIICQGTIFTCDIIISDFVTINLYCTVGHDVFIGKYSSLMPSVNTSGEVIIGEGVFIGTGAAIVNQMNIGAGTIIGAGAVVSNSLPNNCTAVGVPARPIKYHNDNE